MQFVGVKTRVALYIPTLRSYEVDVLLDASTHRYVGEGGCRLSDIFCQSFWELIFSSWQRRYRKNGRFLNQATWGVRSTF